MYHKNYLITYQNITYLNLILSAIPSELKSAEWVFVLLKHHFSEFRTLIALNHL